MKTEITKMEITMGVEGIVTEIEKPEIGNFQMRVISLIMRMIPTENCPKNLL